MMVIISVGFSYERKKIFFFLFETKIFIFFSFFNFFFTACSIFVVVRKLVGNFFSFWAHDGLNEILYFHYKEVQFNLL